MQDTLKGQKIKKTKFSGKSKDLANFVMTELKTLKSI